MSGAYGVWRSKVVESRGGLKSLYGGGGQATKWGPIFIGGGDTSRHHGNQKPINHIDECFCSKHFLNILAWCMA